MLEKPDLQDEQIIACLQDEYGLLKDREQSFQYSASNFLPNGVLEIAYETDQTLREG
jgi:hypothetical protein